MEIGYTVLLWSIVFPEPITKMCYVIGSKVTQPLSVRRKRKMCLTTLERKSWDQQNFEYWKAYESLAPEFKGKSALKLKAEAEGWKHYYEYSDAYMQTPLYYKKWKAYEYAAYVVEKWENFNKESV